MSGNFLELTGLDEIQHVLGEIAPNKANNLARSFIHGVASEAAKEMRKRAPKDEGDLRKAIKAKRKRSKPFKPVSDVVVTKGKNEKHNAFYWHFIEFGTSNLSERPFVRPAADDVQANIARIAEQQFMKKLESAIKRELKKNG